MIAYKISNLIQFYLSTIIKIIGTSSQLATSITELNDISQRIFFDALNEQASIQLRADHDPNPDLLAPRTVRETVSQLKEILSCYDSSLLNNIDKEKQIEKVLTASLDPLLQLCVEGSAKLNAIECATFMINSLHYIHVFSFNLDGLGFVPIHKSTRESY